MGLRGGHLDWRPSDIRRWPLSNESLSGGSLGVWPFCGGPLGVLIATP